MSRPTIGVVVPARNAAGTLARTLSSVSSQTDPPDAVVVVDDGSSDETGRIAVDAGAQVLSTTGVGVAAARNRGIAALSTEYVAFLDADDEWSREYCEAARRVIMRRWPQLLVACRLDVTADGHVFGRRVIDPTSLTPVGLLHRNTITTSGVIASIEALKNVGGFDEHLRYGEDLDLWVRLLAAGALVDANPESVLYTVRDDPESLSKIRDVERNRLSTLDKLAPTLGVSGKEARALRNVVSLDVGRRFLKSGWCRDAIRCLWDARRRPESWGLLVLSVLPRPAYVRLRTVARSRRHA